MDLVKTLFAGSEKANHETPSSHGVLRNSAA